MTPEIALHLITRNCRLWHGKGDDSPFTDPFWAFYWPGGQVLTRYVDNLNVLFLVIKERVYLLVQVQNLLSNLQGSFIRFC